MPWELSQNSTWIQPLSLTHSQLALQWHAGVDALAQCWHTLLHRTHFHVDQAAAGVALGRPWFPVFRRRHPAFLHPLELDCRANTNTQEVIVTAQITTTVSQETGHVLCITWLFIAVTVLKEHFSYYFQHQCIICVALEQHLKHISTQKCRYG